jgi:hypothetical protein
MIKIPRKVLDVLEFGAENGLDGVYFETQFNDGKHELVVARNFSGAYTIAEIEAVLGDVKRLQKRVDAFGHSQFRITVEIANDLEVAA